MDQNKREKNGRIFMKRDQTREKKIKKKEKTSRKEKRNQKKRKKINEN